MRRNIILSILCACIGIAATAQEIKVNETKAKFDQQYLPALETTIYYSSEKTVFRAFKKQLKNFDGKTKGKKGLIFGDNLLITDISTNTIDVYAITRELKAGNIALLVAFDLGETFITKETHPEQYIIAEKLLRDFALKLSQEGFNMILKNEEEALNDIKKNYENIITRKENLKKEIENYKERIADNEQQITECEQDIENTLNNIIQQEEKLKTLQQDYNKIK